jgi:hypothetical protein
MAYAKSIAAVLTAILAAVIPALYTDGPLGWAGWVNVVILACGAVHVYNSANLPGSWDYAKLIAAVVSAAAVALSSALSDGVTRGEWIQVAIAALGALVVWRVPNAAAETAQGGRHEAPEQPPPRGVL